MYNALIKGNKRHQSFITANTMEYTDDLNRLCLISGYPEYTDRACRFVKSCIHEPKSYFTAQVTDLTPLTACVSGGVETVKWLLMIKTRP